MAIVRGSCRQALDLMGEERNRVMARFRTQGGSLADIFFQRVESGIAVQLQRDCGLIMPSGEIRGLPDGKRRFVAAMLYQEPEEMREPFLEKIQELFHSSKPGAYVRLCREEGRRRIFLQILKVGDDYTAIFSTYRILWKNLSKTESRERESLIWFTPADDPRGYSASGSLGELAWFFSGKYKVMGRGQRNVGTKNRIHADDWETPCTRYAIVRAGVVNGVSRQSSRKMKDYLSNPGKFLVGGDISSTILRALDSPQEIAQINPVTGDLRRVRVYLTVRRLHQ